MTAATATSAVEVPAVQRGNRSSFRSFFSFEATAESLAAILDQFSRWLQERFRVDVDLSTNRDEQINGSRLVALHNIKADGRQLRLVWALKGEPDIWTTELTAHLPEPGQRGWLHLVVSSDRGATAAVPAVFDRLVDVLLDPRDGEMQLFSEAKAVGEAQVDEILDAICDDTRTGLLFIAGSEESLPYDPWVSQVQTWSHRARGMSQARILNPRATAELRELLGRSHEVLPGTIRTFRPGADPAVATDGLRHRVLGSRRLAQDDDHAVRGLLTRVARWQANESPAPAVVVRARRDLDRVGSSLLVNRIFAPQAPVLPEPPSPPEPQARPQPVAPDPGAATPAPATTDVDSVSAEPQQFERIRLQWQQDQLDAARAELESRLNELGGLHEELDRLEGLYREELSERTIAEHLRVRAEDEVRWLRGELRQRHAYDVSEAPLPRELETDPPTDFHELADRLIFLEDESVFFTGDLEVVRGLADIDSSGKIAVNAWEALLTLGSYLKAKCSGDFSGALFNYLKGPPPGYRGWDAGKYAPTESDATIGQFGHLRQFPVPTAVDPSGRYRMYAHFRLGKVGIVSPRLHFLDAADSGAIYVGYIGPHLRTVGTN